MVVQHNLPAVNAKGYYDKNVAGLKKSSEKLASGYRINRAKDDAAGLAVSEKMRSQIRGIKQAIRNSQDGINLVQTFEGALGETVHIIHRMGELATESANGTYDNPTDRAAIQLEFDQLCSEVNQIADTDFNGLCVLNGGRMADGFTFVTENGTMWLTPSEMSFPEDGFVSTFQETEGFPEIEMWINILPEAKQMATYDKDLMEAFGRLNDISVRSFYNNGVPEFSLIGVKDEDKDVFSIETVNGSGIISITTPKSGKVPVAKASSTELPHYASSSAIGEWRYTSNVATGSLAALDPTLPENAGIDVSKYLESYVDGPNATKAERQAYLDWIRATSCRATLTNDTLFDKDANPSKFTWNVDGQTYEIPVDGNGNPTGKADLKVYPNTSRGPQIIYKDFRFIENDENYKPNYTEYFSIGSTYYSATAYTYMGGQRIDHTNLNMTSEFYMNTWLNKGQIGVTFKFDKDDGLWYDSVDNYATGHDPSYYGIDYEMYDRTNLYYIRNGYVNRNLYNLFEEDGSLPDDFTLSVNLSTPYYRTYSEYGMHFVKDVRNDDFSMKELDPANPAAGGIDYKVARHGAVYVYDGLTQPDGTVGAWKDEEGNVVNLEDEGVYLPTNLDSTYTAPLHDGMKITVFNPTMVGEDYIQARILATDPNREVNYYREIYDNITYSEDIILQVNSRSKDAVNFTFNYDSENIGELQPDLDCTAKGLGLTELSLATQDSANYAIDSLSNALNKVLMIRSSFGAIQNRLDHKINDLTVTGENITASESQIRDVDMAKEQVRYTKNSVLQQAAQTMLAQASRQPEIALQLLG